MHEFEDALKFNVNGRKTPEMRIFEKYFSFFLRIVGWKFCHKK